MGRPTECTPKLTAQMADLIRKYGNVELCCARARISKVTHYAWMEKGERAEEADSNTWDGQDVVLYRDYMNAIKEAQADFAIDNIDVIRAGDKGWQARAWLNERILPAHFSLKQQMEHSGSVSTGTAPIATPSERDERLRAMGITPPGPH